MSTHKEVLFNAKAFLEKAVVKEAESDAFILFEEAFGIDRTGFMLKADEEASKDCEKHFMEMLKTRTEGIPVQYIINKAYFYGNEFYVDENVLIPRFDTEVLVEQVSKISKKDASVLDMCTGSGCIIISLAKLLKDGSYTGADISKGALEVARKNADKLNVTVEFIESDLFSNVDKTFDVIVSNPPYIEEAVINTLDNEVKLCEPYIALCGGIDGLDFYKKITNDAKYYLKDKGILAFEIGYNQGFAVKNIMEDNGFTNVRIIKDLAGLDRVVIGIY